MFMTFGQIIKHYRKQQGYTQEQLANILCIDRSEVSKYETNRLLPSPAKARILRIALGLTYEEFYEAFENGLREQDPEDQKLQSAVDDFMQKHSLSSQDMSKVVLMMLHDSKEAQPL